jgi:hypothetical protein
MVTHVFSKKLFFKYCLGEHKASFNISSFFVFFFPSKSDRNGNILPEEMASFALTDSRTAVLDISEDMIYKCIRDAKYNTSGKTN